MLNQHTPQAPAEQADVKHSPDAIAILDDLGTYIHKTAALLRAAMNTGAGEETDQAWLHDLAFDQINECERRYFELAGVEPKGAQL